MKKIGKFFKGLMYTVAAIVVLLVVLVFTHSLWLGPVATFAANQFGPAAVGGDFHVGRINLSVDVLSCFTDVIIVKDIEVSDLYVDYVSPKEEKQPAAEETSVDLSVDGVVDAVKNAQLPSFTGSSEKEDEFKLNKKLIINRVAILNVSGKYEGIPFMVPSIELHDLGKDSGGYDLDQMNLALGNEIIASILAQATDLGKLAGNLISGVNTDNASAAINSAKDALKGALDNVDTDAAKAKLKDAKKALKSLFK